jgi:hypothetical protein
MLNQLKIKEQWWSNQDYRLIRTTVNQGGKEFQWTIKLPKQILNTLFTTSQDLFNTLEQEKPIDQNTKSQKTRKRIWWELLETLKNFAIDPKIRNSTVELEAITSINFPTQKLN